MNILFQIYYIKTKSEFYIIKKLPQIMELELWAKIGKNFVKTKPINIYFHHPAQFQSPCWIFTISSSESYRPTFAIQIHTKILTIQYTYLYFVRSTWNIEISTFWQAYRKAQSYIYAYSTHFELFKICDDNSKGYAKERKYNVMQYAFYASHGGGDTKKYICI